MRIADCPLCLRTARTELWSNAHVRVIDAEEPEFPGLTRVIWHDHVREMTDLAESQRHYVMSAVWAVESVMRQHLAPTKVNLAQFGNMVPHLHWHVIPRWTCDPRFPDAIWAPRHDPMPRQADDWAQQRGQTELALPGYHAALREALAALPEAP
ncbi:MAG: HIT family protein [Pusillimonas sp.]